MAVIGAKGLGRLTAGRAGRRLGGALLGSVLLAGCGSAGSTAVSTSSTPPPATSASSSAISQTGSAGSAGDGSVDIALEQDWLSHGIHIGVQLGGGPRVRMTVDTGSNGVVVARRLLGPQARSLSPREMFTGFTYSSSGNSYSGEWMQVPLVIGTADGSGPTATTVPILVRAVDQSCTRSGTCNSDPDSISVAMVGVGFDRAQDGSAAPAHAGPGLNPFLQLTAMVAGTIPKSYEIGSAHLVLGPGASEMATFSTVQLQRTTGNQPADWQAPTACLAVLGSVPPQCGSLLLDTGLSYAIVQVPAGVQPPTVPAAAGTDRPTVADGQTVEVTIAALGPTPIYRFVTGSTHAPQSVQWGHNLHAGSSFFNISRFALSETDYLYDATDGRVGFRATQ